MMIIGLARVMLSSGEGWFRFDKLPPWLQGLFVILVLPLSLLPPVMLYRAGTGYGDLFVPGYGGKAWGAVAVAFFCMEMLTLAGTGWLTRQVAATYKASMSRRDSYVLAIVAPVPLWLSSLSLLVPSLALSVTMFLLGLAAACALIYHGVFSICRLREELTAAAIMQTVMGVDLAAWAFLLLLVMMMS